MICKNIFKTIGDVTKTPSGFTYVILFIYLLAGGTNNTIGFRFLTTFVNY